MRLFSSLIALAFFALSSFALNPEDAIESIVDITPDNIKRYIGAGRHILVEFYAPWCGHCKSLTPEYKKLADAVAGDKGLSTRLVIAKLNADEHRSLGEQFGVEGFPTLKYFAPGSTDGENYEGKRAWDDMLQFLQEKIFHSREYARIAPLTALAKKFVEKKLDSSIIAEAEKVAAGVDELEKENAALYVFYMRRVKERGSGYIAGEVARLQKVIDSGNVNNVKLDQFMRKISVLSSFLDETLYSFEGEE